MRRRRRKSSPNQHQADHDARNGDWWGEDEVGPEDGPGEEAFKSREDIWVCSCPGSGDRFAALGDLLSG